MNLEIAGLVKPNFVMIEDYDLSGDYVEVLVDDVDLHGRVEFSIQSVGDNGFCSEKCHFAITGALSMLVRVLFVSLDGRF